MTLLWTSNGLLEPTGMAVGNFGEPALAEPTLTLTNDKRCAWAALPEGWDRRVAPPV